MDVPLVPVPTTAADDDAAAGSPSPSPEMDLEEDGGGGKVVYVAVSGNRNKALPTLRWALRRHAPAPEGRKKTALLVLVYVHRPATMIPIFSEASHCLISLVFFSFKEMVMIQCI